MCITLLYIYIKTLKNLRDLKTMQDAPKCFISYSHDNEDHKKWVLMLSTRLVNNGVDVKLDQWDLRLGSDLPSFMEKGLNDVDRVIIICSENYVKKANEGRGGVGYEKMILTATLMENINSEKIIPLIRNNSTRSKVPTFLSSKIYTDFRKDDEFENSYQELIREIHGEKIKARPPLGKNPYIQEIDSHISSSILIQKSKYISPFSDGFVEFHYENNNGIFTLGEGSKIFDTRFSNAGNGFIHIYKVPDSNEGIALATHAKEIKEIGDAALLNYTSDSYTLRDGEIFTIANKKGFFAAIKIEKILSRISGDKNSIISFSYKIKEDKNSIFSD